MPFVTLGQESIYYSASRPGNEVSLVLIHGSGGSHLSWPAEARRLASADVYALDLPGHGKSGGQGRTTVEDYAELVQAFVQELGLHRVVLTGHSLGGAVVLSCALQKPAWLQGLVLVGTGGRLKVAPQILDGLRQDFPGTAAKVNDVAFGSQAPQALKRESEQAFLAADPEVMYGDFAACNEFDVMDRLEAIECPALVVCGDEDRLTPEKYGRHLAETLPRAELTVLQGCGHMMALEKPAEFSRAVQGFVEQLGG
jgi:pimeloyl-ACP methyl ester carboxylesterase